MAKTQELELPVQKTEQEIRAEIMGELKLSGRLVQNEIVEQPKNLINEFKSKLVVPRRVIFEIKGVETDDAMYDSSYIAGKAVGISGYKLTSQIVNRNLSSNHEEDNFVTGFEVEDIYQSNLPDEVKSQRIKDVQTARAWLENKYTTSLGNKNWKFWADYTIVINDLGEVYDTNKKGTTKANDPLLMYYSILGGGHPDIALSNDEAKANNKFYYLTIKEDEANRKFSGNKSRINAMSSLKEIMDNWSLNETLSFVYYLVRTPHGYTLSTPKDILIQELSDFIEAVNFKTEKKKKPSEFIEAVELMKADKDKVLIEATLRAAIYFGFVNSTKDKEFVNRETDFHYGTSINDAVTKLLSPKYMEELSNIKKRVQDKWKI